MKQMSEEFSPKTELGKAAHVLDTNLNKFENLVGELSRANLETDKGYEKALLLESEIISTRALLEKSMQEFAVVLNQTRLQNESAEKIVAQKSSELALRKSEVEKLKGRFGILSHAIKQINGTMSQLKVNRELDLSETDKTEILSQLPEIDKQLEILVNETKSLLDDAVKTNIKSIERDADSLWKSLTTVRNKFKLFIEQKTQPVYVH